MAEACARRFRGGHLKIAAAFAAAWAPPVSAVAGESPPPEQVLITARPPDPVGNNAYSTTLIDEQQLQISNQIDSALRQVPGLSLFRRNTSLSANPTVQGVSLALHRRLGRGPRAGDARRRAAERSLRRLGDLEFASRRKHPGRRDRPWRGRGALWRGRADRRHCADRAGGHRRGIVDVEGGESSAAPRRGFRQCPIRQCEHRRQRHVSIRWRMGAGRAQPGAAPPTNR